jgi:hypothetical protein
MLTIAENLEDNAHIPNDWWLERSEEEVNQALHAS